MRWKLIPVLLVSLTFCNSSAAPVSSRSAGGEASENSTSGAISRSRNNAIVNAARKVSPAVVSITVLSTRVVEERPFFIDPFWREIIPPTYRLERIQSLGSGVVISPDGYIITNQHVVGDNPDSIIVTFPDASQYTARLVGKVDKLDIAILKVKSGRKDFPYAELGNSDSLVVGEWAIAIGNPLGYYLDDVEPTVTAGIISGIHRTIRGMEDRVYRNMIQTDAAINPGNSGGPLVDADGRVIGINTFIFSKSGGFEGIGFAIPINTVRKVFSEIVRYGHLREAIVPIEVQDLDNHLREAVGYGGKFGVIVVNSMLRDVREGDIIVSVNGQTIKNTGDWEDMTYILVPGDVLKLRIFRNGKYIDVRVKAKEFVLKPYSGPLGAEVVQMDPFVARKLGIPYTSGVAVLSVRKGSLADFMGLEKGDVIKELNGMKIETIKDFQRAERIVMKSRRVYGRIWRNGQILSFNIVF